MDAKRIQEQKEARIEEQVNSGNAPVRLQVNASEKEFGEGLDVDPDTMRLEA